MTLPARWPPSLRSSLRCDAHSGGHLMSFHIESFLPENHLAEALRADVAAGLTRVPKDLPPKWFYDERGSALFDEITRLPEYYPTRAEREILHARAAEVAVVTGAHTLVELGSGSA